MNLENGFTEQEKPPEQLPSQESIKSVFETLLRGKEYKELSVRSNEEGEVSLYEIEVILENGEKIEYNYQKAKYDYRDPSLPKTAQFSASIHSTLFDADGMPYGGECVANYIDDRWEYPV